MKNADLPAMPSSVELVYDVIHNDAAGYGKASIGLTKREMFAMHAMASWVNHNGSAGDYSFSEKEAARLYVECADALLEK